jgi:serine/threonine-protein kinase
MGQATTVRPGDVLAGKYRVERVLGQGGMGYVVAARHLQLDQLVAMKFLRRGAIDETEATGRFHREAKAAVKLKNEHIARVFDVGTLDTGEPYMVMEYLEGQDLSQMAKQRGRLGVGESCEYVLQAAEALAEAHSLGIVHRDIKLANLFVTTGAAGGPLVKVLDFGISKTNPFGEQDHDMTRTASMLGSPRFMSPEQMRDPRGVDARSDIWSLGVVLYRLTGGRPPFEADTLGRLLTMVMHEQEPPLSSLAKDIPPGFEQVVGRCLAKDPAMRFANVAELAYAIAPFAVDPGRARSSADRIAAMLSVARSGEVPQAMGSGGRTSAPPHMVDTGGTAAPWAGTQSTALAPATFAKSPVVWAALGVLSLLAAVGVFMKVRHDRVVEEGLSEPIPTVVAAPATATTPEVPPEVTAAPTPTTPVVATPPAPTVIAPPPQPTIVNKPAATDDKGKQRPFVAPPPPQPARKPSRPANPAGRDDGIPSTRD